MTPAGFEIRELAVDDGAALAQAYRRNRDHLAPWDPVRPPSFYTSEGQEEAVAQQLAAVERGLLLAWVLTDQSRILGRVSLHNIVLGAFRSAAVGYWVDGDHQGRGLATAALDYACGEALTRGLHRIEASTLVDNDASQAVLIRCGFEQYGLAPRYLHIAGRWQDHRLFQRILHDGGLRGPDLDS